MASPCSRQRPGRHSSPLSCAEPERQRRRAEPGTFRCVRFPRRFLATGAYPSARSVASVVSSGLRLISTVGARCRSPSLASLRWAAISARSAWLVAVEDTGGGGDAHAPVAASGVRDQVRQRLWERPGSGGGQVGRDVLRGSAGVQSPADTVAAEPPHRCGAAGLPVRDGVQEGGQPRGRCAGDDGGEVGADPGSRGGRGQQPPALDAEPFRIAGPQVDAEGGKGASREYAEEFGLADHGGERSAVLE